MARPLDARRLLATSILAAGLITVPACAGRGPMRLAEQAERLAQHAVEGQLWDKALVVVTADHGVSFRGGDLRRRPTRTNLAELAFTPLFMKLPGEDQGRVVDTHVQTIDILPTMAAALGIKIPWKTDGRSVLTNRSIDSPGRTLCRDAYPSMMRERYCVFGSTRV